jgi:hypothetical protein
MKNKTTQGLGNTNLLSFPKHDSLKLETSESDSSEIITINQCQAAKHACSHTHMHA